MKKLLSLLMVLMVLLTSGCETAATLLIDEVVEGEPGDSDNTITDIDIPIPKRPESELDDDGEKNKIAKSTTYRGANENTFLLDKEINITGDNKKGRVLLATDAKIRSGKIDWKESNYWVLAVMVDGDGDGEDDGVYNLYFGDMKGKMYVEVNEYLIQGISTPVITMYLFGAKNREIREYIFDGEFFVETITYTTDTYATGINNVISTFPEYIYQP